MVKSFFVAGLPPPPVMPFFFTLFFPLFVKSLVKTYKSKKKAVAPPSPRTALLPPPTPSPPRQPLYQKLSARDFPARRFLSMVSDEKEAEISAGCAAIVLSLRFLLPSLVLLDCPNSGLFLLVNLFFL